MIITYYLETFSAQHFVVEFSSADAWWSVLLAILACVIFKPYKVNNAKSAEGPLGYLVIPYAFVCVLVCTYTIYVYI